MNNHVRDLRNRMSQHTKTLADFAAFAIACREIGMTPSGLPCRTEGELGMRINHEVATKAVELKAALNFFGFST